MMDEATASLDSQSERVVQQALTRLMVGRTTFVIAHRLSTIVHADHIIFIENGILTGAGTHTELVQDRKSTRLNSSHVAISYAVFCLKKKTKHGSSRRTRNKSSSSRNEHTMT